jgi:hypothetical protein
MEILVQRREREVLGLKGERSKMGLKERDVKGRRRGGGRT